MWWEITPLFGQSSAHLLNKPSPSFQPTDNNHQMTIYYENGSTEVIYTDFLIITLLFCLISFAFYYRNVQHSKGVLENTIFSSQQGSYED